MLSRLRGMFAIAIWDEREQSLFLARDHFGIKPLYYTSINGNLYFASEIKQLLLLDDLDQFDHAHQMIYEYMISLLEHELLKEIIH